MKWLKLSLLLAAMGLPAANGAIITIESATSDSFVYDIEWGPSAPPDHEEIVMDAPGGFRVVAEEFTTTGMFSARSVLVPSGSYYFEGTLNFTQSRAFAPLDIVPGAYLPVSITPTADGYGAHFVFTGMVPPVYPPPPVDEEVPDGGATLAMLALAFAGCATLKGKGRWI